MLERGVGWNLADLYRAIRLQCRQPVDAINDPELNRQLQALRSRGSRSKGRTHNHEVEVIRKQAGCQQPHRHTGRGPRQRRQDYWGRFNLLTR
jgi:hypothetical protein